LGRQIDADHGNNGEDGNATISAWFIPEDLVKPYGR